MGAKSECGIGGGWEGSGSSPTAPSPAWLGRNRAGLFSTVIIFRFPLSVFHFSLAALILITQAAAAAPALRLTEDAAGFTLDNGLITARIDKRSGFFSVKQKELALIERGYWSQVGRSSAGDIAQFAPMRSGSILIDPGKNNGER